MAYIKSITTTANDTYDIRSKLTAAIPYGECDSTSTATAFTATVTGLDALYDGACVMLKNGVVTSAANFTININNLGAKPCYNNMATGNDIVPTAPTRDTTIFNQNYTMLFVYSESIVEGGGWICYRGYDGNTNTIGYQLRTNSSNMTAADTGYRYRIWFTSADGKKWVPINTSTSTNSTTARTLNTRAIDPFGAIVYRATNGTCNSGSGLGATGIWQQYTLTIGYSYVKTLTYPAPVYLKCTPQTNGSAVMNDIVQSLPSSNDGKIYIFLGVAYSATAMELHADHPVYWHDGTGIRLWTGSAIGGSSVDPATTTPLMDGTAAVGTSAKYAREDHVHPKDTSKQDALVSGTNIKTVNNTSLLGSGDVAVQPTLVSGTNIKTINNESILGSGNLDIGGGSGGVSITNTTATIAVADWSNNTCTKSVAGVTASNTVVVTYAPASKAVYTAADIYCTAQGSGTLTFACTTTPTAAVTVNVMVIDGGTSVYNIINAATTINSITLDGSYGSGVTTKETSAPYNATVTVSTAGKKQYLHVNNDAVQTHLIGEVGMDYVYWFTMPDCDVTLTTGTR